MADDVVKKIPLPKGFDQTNSDHMMTLTTRIQEAIAKNPKLKGYSLFRIDDNLNTAFIAPMNYESGDSKSDVQYIQLQPGQAQDPKNTVKRYETDYPGYYAVDLNTVKNVLTLERLDGKTLDVRRVIAGCMNVNLWDIRVTPTPEKGWKVRIRKDACTYVPSRHDRKIQEAVERQPIGRPGWFFKADAESNVIMIYPGKLPTFPKIIPMPKELIGKNDLRHAYFGMKLPDKGRETGDWLYHDWKVGPGILVAAATNNGKSVVINSLIYAALEAGCDLIICDDEDKSVDFQWCRDYVMDRGWGCDGPEYCAATTERVLELCRQRAAVIKQYGAENWWGLPDEVRAKLKPIFFVADEIPQWARDVKVTPGLAKDNPTRIRAEYEKGIHAVSSANLLAISQKARFAGIFFLYCSQSIRLQDGLDPGVRLNLTTIIAPGTPTPDPIKDLIGKKRCPEVPEYIINDGRSIGAGVTQLAGQGVFVYKGFYEDGWSQVLRKRLQQVRPAPGNSESGRWTWQEVCDMVPLSLERPDDGTTVDDEDTSPSRLESEGGFGVDGRDVADHDAPLKGAAKAAHVSAIEAARQSARLAAEKGM